MTHNERRDYNRLRERYRLQVLYTVRNMAPKHREACKVITNYTLQQLREFEQQHSNETDVTWES